MYNPIYIYIYRSSIFDSVHNRNCKMHSNSQKQDGCRQLPSAIDDYLPENVFHNYVEGDLSDSETDTACHEYVLKGDFALVK